VRLDDDERSCILVIMGALEDRRKELIAVAEAYRESKLAGQEVLRELKGQGLQRVPRLVVDDGALGFWPALEEGYGSVTQQRYWGA
jgi:transposase-like protein